MPTGLVSVLDSLLRLWPAALGSFDAVHQLDAPLQELVTLSEDPGARQAADPAALKSKLVAMAQWLADLAPQLSLNHPSLSIATAYLGQIDRAASAVWACSSIAAGLHLGRSDALRVVSAARLVFGPGKAALLRMRSAPPDAALLGVFCSTCEGQAMAVAACLALVAGAGDAMAGFATAYGQEMLGWLATLTQVLPPDAASLLPGVRAVNMYVSYAYALHAAMTHTAFRRQRGLEGGMQLAALEVLLLRALPCLSSWPADAAADAPSRAQACRALGQLPEIVGPLAPAIRQFMRQPGAVTAVRNAGRLMSALPADRLPAMQLAEVQAAAVELLAKMDLAVGAASAPPRAAGGSSSASRSRAGSREQVVPAPCAVQLALAEEVVAALPQFVAMLRSLLADSQCSGQQLFGACLPCATLLGHACSSYSDADIASSWGQLQRWIAAADAAVRLLPLAAQLHARMPAPDSAMRAFVGSAEGVGPAQWLADAAITVWQRASICLALLVQRGLGGLSGSQAAEAGALVWQLHSSGCRWLHGLLAGSAALPPGMQGCREHLRTVHCFLEGNVLTALLLMEKGGDHSDPRRRRAVCTAHWAALQALAGDPGNSLDPSTEGRAADTLLLLALHCPQLVDAAFMAALERALPQADLRAIQSGGFLTALCKQPEQRAWVVAAALQSSVPRRLLDAAQALRDRGDSGAVESFLSEFWNLLGAANAAYMATRGQLGWSAADSLLGLLSGSARSMPAEAGLLLRMEKAWRAVGAQMEDDYRSLGTRAAIQAFRRLLQPLAQLGTALQEYWQQPEQQAVRTLEVAQAAAARSCAYLRCSNLALGGGPAAGQGEGSSKCSACRVAWYCGTACSHADWRCPGGHKHVCKALGAARAAERAAVRAQQQGAAGVEGRAA